jgi:hypothetical protein
LDIANYQQQDQQQQQYNNNQGNLLSPAPTSDFLDVDGALVPAAAPAFTQDYNAPSSGYDTHGAPQQHQYQQPQQQYAAIAAAPSYGSNNNQPSHQTSQQQMPS